MSEKDKTQVNTRNDEHTDHSTMTHEGMNHSTMNSSEHMNHEHMNHEAMNHSKMNHSKINHEDMSHIDDMQIVNHTDHSTMNHGHMNHSGAGHDHGDMVADMNRRFVVSAIASVPIFLLSKFMGFGPIINVPALNWLIPILATFIFFYGGKPFFTGMVSEFKQKNPAMMSLISLGIISSYVYSIYAFVSNLINPHAMVMDFFWELASLILIMLIGHSIESKAVSRATQDLQGIASLLPKRATKINVHGKEELVEVTEIQKGDILLIKPNEKIPADGKLIKGNTDVNESLLSGESKNVNKKIGDELIGGSVNGNHEIQLEVTKTGSDSFISQIQQQVENSQANKTKIQGLADRVASYLFYIAVAVAVVAFGLWLVFAGNLPIALERAVTVLVIACPHALGLAVPLVIARSISLSIENNVLVKNQKANESAQYIKYLILDKTGTLTDGKFTVSQFDSVDKQYTAKDILGLFASLENSSDHPLAQSIVKKAKELKIGLTKLEHVTNIPGTGLSANLKNDEIKIVNQKYLTANNINLPKQDMSQDLTTSYLLINEKLVGFVSQGDQIKKNAKQFIDEIKKRNITPVMLTGDSQTVAMSVAHELGIEEYQSQMVPDDKFKYIENLVNQGKKVMMVGDGVNDAPALALATIGVSFYNGTDMAQNSADVVLLNPNLMNIVSYLDIAKKTRNKIISNLWLGAGYNILAIPLAAGILAFIGFTLSPAVGAILMTLSTILVAFNALTLNYTKHV